MFKQGLAKFFTSHGEMIPFLAQFDYRRKAMGWTTGGDGLEKHEFMLLGCLCIHNNIYSLAHKRWGWGCKGGRGKVQTVAAY